MRSFTLIRLLLVLTVPLVLAWSPAVSAQTPIDLYESYAGDMNYVITGGSLRTNPNSGGSANPCAVGASSSNPLTGIPAGSTIEAAFLYWSGSGSTVDSNVVFNGVPVTATRVFTAPFVFGTTTFDFFSGFADVTSQVATTGNGTYTLSGLTVNTGAPHCAVQGVLAGWTLLVIYENSVTERLRVINVFDGFQFFRGSSITLTPSNFIIPASPDGSHAIVTWEGDIENSAALNGFQEQLSFNGAPLTDALNPVNNQFNSTINGIPSTTDYGVDIDRYDITSLLNPGDTSASTVYSSGGDLVLLQLEVIAVANEPTVDLGIDKTHSGDFIARQDNDYTITVNNTGPSDETGTITVTDTLPSGLTYTSANGTGWSCAAAGSTVTCTHPGPLAAGSALPSITLTTLVSDSVVPTVSNTAEVAGTLFDNRLINNQSTDIATVVIEHPNLTLTKMMFTVSDPFNNLTNPKAIPGAVIEYSLLISNSGLGPVDDNQLAVSDALPPNTALFVDDASGDPVQFVDGATSSELAYSYASDVAFSNQPGGGSPYNYVPTPDAEGFDTAVTGFVVRPQGILPGSSGGSDPAFTLQFRTRVN